MAQGMKIMVMLGGPSAEREVSLRSGSAVAQALRSRGHLVTELDPRTPDWSLPADTAVVFLALHGTYGEDGTVQKRLEELQVPYTGCDADASRIAFDKNLTKLRCVSAGVPTARFFVADSPEASWPIGWNPPVVLKPLRQGSSVGLQFVDRVSDWSRSLAEAFRFDTEVLVEEKIVGRETTVGILDDQPLPIVEVRPHAGVYDYQSKYTSGATEYSVSGPVRGADRYSNPGRGDGRIPSGWRTGLRPRRRDGPQQRRTGRFGGQYSARDDRDKLISESGGCRGVGLPQPLSENDRAGAQTSKAMTQHAS